MAAQGLQFTKDWGKIPYAAWILGVAGDQITAARLHDLEHTAHLVQAIMGFCQLSLEWSYPGSLPYMGALSMGVAAQVWTYVEEGMRGIAPTAT